MKKSLTYLFAFSVMVVLGSCTKAYLNDGSSAANNSAVPINTVNGGFPSFDWSGSAPMSATITYSDGTSTNWVADAGSISYYYSVGYNIFSGSMGGKKLIGLWLGNTYPGNNYHMGLKNGSQYLEYTDSSSVPAKYVYWTYNAPINSGGVDVIRSDTFLAGTPGYMQGLFYGEATDGDGRIVNISNGYYYFQKW